MNCRLVQELQRIIGNLFRRIEQMKGIVYGTTHYKIYPIREETGMKSKRSLRAIVNEQIIERLQNAFTDATGLVAVTVDNDCKQVVPVSWQKSCAFCRLLLERPESNEMCYRSDMEGSRKALEARCPNIYRCHANIINISTPIIIDGEHLGYVLCGQALSSNPTPTTVDEMVRLASRFDIPMDEARIAVGSIPIKREDAVEAAATLLHFVASYIVEMGIRADTQRKLLEETSKRAELEKAVAEARFRELEAQINPHFLFNTLNTIARLALLEGAERTEKVVYGLGDLVRYHLGKTREIITVGEEFEHIEHYFVIQRARFGDRMEFRTYVSETALKCHVPSMMIQPIVENAVVHGLEPKPGQGFVFVKCIEQNGRLMIVVEDNGMGCTDEIVEACQTGRIDKSELFGIGINNVRERLKHYFGDEQSFDLRNKEGGGTIVTMSFPCI